MSDINPYLGIKSHDGSITEAVGIDEFKREKVFSIAMPANMETMNLNTYIWKVHLNIQQTRPRWHRELNAKITWTLVEF